MILVVLFVLLFPLKIKVFNEDNYLFINIYNLINLKLNLFALIEGLDKKSIEKQRKNIKILNKIQFKEVDLRIQGLNFDYKINGAYFGILYAVLGVLDSICFDRDIKLYYDLKYQGDKSIEFKSIVRAKVAKVLLAFIRL